jgi:DNA-binding LacI/PurR family transcriptional regulator
VEGGKQAARELLTDHPELTALFCYNDLVAVGVLQASAALGWRVPDDLAIVGFDDIPMAALVTPPLTTCRSPRRELGLQAMQLLLDRDQRLCGRIHGDRATAGSHCARQCTIDVPRLRFEAGQVVVAKELTS